LPVPIAAAIALMVVCKAQAAEAKLSGVEIRIGALGLVVFLVIAALFAAKKFGPRHRAKGSLPKNLKILETLSMGGKRSISMITVGNRRFVVGNSAQRISLLTALPESIPLIAKPKTLSEAPNGASNKEYMVPFGGLFEVEKKRRAQHAPNLFPDDIRTKTRPLKEALEQ
jgi:flagellar biogenesis protein FliO